MFKIKVRIQNAEFEREYAQKILASDALSDFGLLLPKPCAGKGICGKCKIILNGKSVLACHTYIESDAIIDFIQENIQGITEGYVQNFKKDPVISEGYGAAIDIGTTTIAGYIYKFPECEIVKKICIQNPQMEFGADVISRITFFKNGGKDKLFLCLKDAIEEITKGFKVEKYVICANTTMMYLLTKNDPEELAVAPYKASRLFGEWKENAYLVNCTSAYIGADITSAVLSSGMLNDKTSLLVDIGTNGEMVLNHNGEIYCCSTAAGPCFEGAGIDCGMLATSGAIDKVLILNGEIEYTTIANKTALGICGSGLVCAVAALLQKGIIDKTGYMEGKFYFGKTGVYLSPEDVRKYQLAKSAIASGIDTLLKEANVTLNEIETFYIAGGFGSFLDIDSAVKTGLIPKELAKKSKVLGNAAGMGAGMILQSKEYLENSKKIMQKAKILSLAENEYFMNKYIDNMMFAK